MPCSSTRCGRLLAKIADEVRISMGLVEERRYIEHFERYVTHVSYWLKHEKVPNPLTGVDEEPDQELMADVERLLGVRSSGVSPGRLSRRGHRKIGAWSLDNPGKRPDYERIFPRPIADLRESFFSERKRQVTKINQDLLVFLVDGPDKMPPDAVTAVRTTLDNLKQRFGYCDKCAKDAVLALLKKARAQRSTSMSDFDERLACVGNRRLGAHRGESGARAAWAGPPRAGAGAPEQGIDGLPVEVVHADLLDGGLVRAASAPVRSFTWPGRSLRVGNRPTTCERNQRDRHPQRHRSLPRRGRPALGSLQLDPGARLRTWPDRRLDETCDLVAPDDRSRGAYDRAKAEAERLVLARRSAGWTLWWSIPRASSAPSIFSLRPWVKSSWRWAQGKLPALVAGAACDFVDVRDVVAGALACRAHRPARRALHPVGNAAVPGGVGAQWAIATGRAAPRLRCPWAWQDWPRPSPDLGALARAEALFTSESLRVLRSQRPVASGKAESELAYRPRPIDETLRDTTPG
jgi:hypothetical protein